ncbi:MAG: hypothetical protein JSS14_22925 [Proteobacteria bacterium]|nr:hypothetical protein [Pseudomonadota bacterium]
MNFSTATINPTADFSMRPLARVAGAHLRPASAMVHGAEPDEAAKGILLVEAKRLAMETAERLWKASSVAIANFITLLMNLLRWIFRPILAGHASSPSQALGAADAGGGRQVTTKGEPNDNSILWAKEIARAAASTPPSQLVPVKGEAVAEVVKAVAKAFPTLDGADPRSLTLATTSSLLDQQAARLLELKARAQEIGQEMNAVVTSLATQRGREPDSMLDLVLADPEEGGEPGDLIRSLFRLGADVEAQANQCQSELENVLLLAKSQGLDLAALIEGTKVPDAVPQWTALVETALPSAPPTLTAAERNSLALVTDPDTGTEAEPTPEEKAQRLKTTLNLSTERFNDHQAERYSA